MPDSEDSQSHSKRGTLGEGPLGGPGVAGYTAGMLPGPHVLNKLDDHVYTQLDELDGVTLYHGRPWHRVLERAFGWRVQALVDYDCGGRLALFLPFVEKRRLGRKVRVSLPLSHSIGPATKPGYRFSFPVWLAPFEIHANVAGMATASPNVVTELDLSRFHKTEELLATFHPSQIQRRLRKAECLELRSSSDHELFEAFAELQARTRRRQGAPTYPKRFFPIMAEELGHVARCHIAKHQGRTVTGIVFIHCGETALYGYGASSDDLEHRKLGANQLAMWSAIREAFEAGCTLIDFGSSPVNQESLWRYKERWGGVTRPLVHSYIGLEPVAQHGPLAQFGGAVLKQMPIPVFKALSPALLKAVV